ncbi:GAF and ANTAR domain-containing protein [Streptomyces sp. NPDC002853]
MTDERVLQLLDSIRHSEGGELSPRWAGRSAAALGLSGVAVSVIAEGPELVCFSDRLSAQLENLQFTLGEGPGIEAARSGTMCLLADVHAAPGPRWSGFLSEVTKLPLRAIFAFPLRWGALRVGTFTGYRRGPGMLSDEYVEDALMLCDALTQFLLHMRLPGAKEAAEGAGAGVMGLHRAEVHQATGMVAALLGIPLAAAMSRLRAEAFILDCDVTDVARAVVRREMTLAANHNTRGGTDNGSSSQENP